MPPDDSSSIPDEVWEKFQQDSEAAIRQTAPKEPSARARMVARKLREQGPGRSEGWRAGTAWGESPSPEQRRSPRGRLWQLTRSLLMVIVVGAIVLFALHPSGAMSLLRDTR
ncbi:MAG: hypothetical protein JO362_11145 [Streptomycetaceae bacterium]|nr:hypothetical protein [Streptomycetaceae bacterium]